MRFGLDSVVYLVGTVFGTLSLAACSNSLRQRNIAIGNQSRAALSQGLYLIITTKDLSGAGYALSVGAGGIAVGSLILLLYSMHLAPVTNFSRKTFFLSPLMLLINTLLVFAAGIAVTVIGRKGEAAVEGYVQGVKVPDATLQGLVRAGGVPLDYWSNAYVKFMVASVWPCVFIAPIVTVFAYRAYKLERPSAQHANNTHAASTHVDPAYPHMSQKPETTHVA